MSDDQSDDTNLDEFSNEFFKVETDSGDDAPATDESTDGEGEEPDPDPNPDPEAEEADGEAEGEDEAEGNEPEEESEPEEKPRKGKTARERIEELVAKNHEAVRANNALLARIEALETKKPDVEPEPKLETARADPDAPKPDDLLEDGKTFKYPLGEFDPDFITDLTRHTFVAVNKAEKEKAENEANEKAINEAKAQLHTDWQEKLVKAGEVIPDLREKAVQLEETFVGLEPVYGEYLASTIMSLEYGPQVLDYLASNIAEARKIVASGPTAATIALGRLEARFLVDPEAEDDNKEKTEIRPTKATTPPPSNRGGGGRFATRPDTDDLDAFSKEFFK